jgi:hypothetical protein
MALTQSAGGSTPFALAAAGIVIAAAGNNLVKGIYAYSFADHKTGVEGLGLLTALAVCGVLPLLWVLA